jgi:hypothetical protein
MWVYVLLPFGYLPYVIVAATMTQRVRCHTHFCRRHKNHWVYRALVIWGGFVAMLALLVGSVAFVISMEPQVNEATNSLLRGLLCFTVIALPLCWLISIPIMQLTAIHPADVTERRLTLKRVAPAFVNAVRDYREKRSNVDEEREEYWSDFRSRRPEASEDVYDPDRGP